MKLGYSKYGTCIPTRLSPLHILVFRGKLPLNTMPLLASKPPFIRRIRTKLRDLQIFWIVARGALITFFAIVLASALLFHYFYTYPGTSEHPDFSLALYAAFALIFFETALPYPDQVVFQALFFILPFLGLTAVIDGVLQFGSALLSRQARGQKWQEAMASMFKDHIIVCGTGRVGYRVILELLKFDREIVAIEVNDEGRFVKRIQELGVPLLFEDATQKESLIKAGWQMPALSYPAPTKNCTTWTSRSRRANYALGSRWSCVCSTRIWRGGLRRVLGSIRFQHLGPGCADLCLSGDEVGREALLLR